MLVSYSDSEGSGDDTAERQTQKPATKPTAAHPGSNFAIDKSTGKIKVNLQSQLDPSSNATHEDERAAKRPRLGGGGGGNAFSGFNAMLPAPKRDNLPPAQNGGTKAPARKVFSLRTGAEPAFSRESDAEFRELFAEQRENNDADEVKKDIAIPSNIPKPSFAKPAPPAPAGKPMMFKPLSVARNNKKKKPVSTTSAASVPQTTSQSVKPPPSADLMTEPKPEPPKKKINLFSSGADPTPSIPIQNEDDDDDDEIIEDLGPIDTEDSLDTFTPVQAFPQTGPQPQSLDSIADDLNLTAAEKRQLFGRSGRGRDGGGGSSSNKSAINVVNFNTDAEYAANQQLIANGESIQHNPVRAIASGKHSLKSLISSAANQKEALEESFAHGKRNKKEAGSKYGW